MYGEGRALQSTEVLSSESGYEATQAWLCWEEGFLQKGPPGFCQALILALPALEAWVIP